MLWGGVKTKGDKEEGEGEGEDKKTGTTDKNTCCS